MSSAFRPPRIGILGFTLVEMLVVIGIIIILATIGVPAYQSFIAKGKSAQCVSNLRQCHLFISDYVAEKGYYMPTQNHTQTDKGLVNNGEIFSILAFEPLGTCTVCPAAEHHGVNAIWGPPARKEPVPQRWRQTGYAANAVIMLFRKEDMTTKPPTLVPFIRPAHIRRPSETVLLADGFQHSTGKDSWSAYPVFNLNWPADDKSSRAEEPINEKDIVPAGGIQFRHSGKANLLYCDGHIASITNVSQLRRKNFSINY